MATPRLSDEDDSLMTLLAVFGPRWSEKDIVSVLEYSNGSVEKAVESILAHDGAGLPPSHFLRTLRPTRSCDDDEWRDAGLDGDCQNLKRRSSRSRSGERARFEEPSFESDACDDTANDESHLFDSFQRQQQQLFEHLGRDSLTLAQQARWKESRRQSATQYNNETLSRDSMNVPLMAGDLSFEDGSKGAEEGSNLNVSTNKQNHKECDSSNGPSPPEVPQGNPRRVNGVGGPSVSERNDELRRQSDDSRLDHPGLGAHQVRVSTCDPGNTEVEKEQQQRYDASPLNRVSQHSEFTDVRPGNLQRSTSVATQSSLLPNHPSMNDDSYQLRRATTTGFNKRDPRFKRSGGTDLVRTIQRQRAAEVEQIRRALAASQEDTVNNERKKREKDEDDVGFVPSARDSLVEAIGSSPDTKTRGGTAEWIPACWEEGSLSRQNLESGTDSARKTREQLNRMHENFRNDRLTLSPSSVLNRNDPGNGESFRSSAESDDEVKQALARREEDDLRRALELSLNDRGTSSPNCQNNIESSFSSCEEPPQGSTLSDQRDRFDAGDDSGNQLNNNWGKASTESRNSVIVSGAGVDAVNGTYIRFGSCNSVGMFHKSGLWGGQEVRFTLFRCLLITQKRKWFISIVPFNIKPGTNEDKDFYAAEGTTNLQKAEFEDPPETGWTPAAPFGRSPAPTCLSQKPSAEGENDCVDILSAGLHEANGQYVRTGSHDGVGVYAKDSFWDGRKAHFTLYRSSFGDGSQRWFISIVPKGAVPGSNADTDLYTVLVRTSASIKSKPPTSEWTVIPGFGVHPPPTCKYAGSVTQVVNEDVIDQNSVQRPRLSPSFRDSLSPPDENNELSDLCENLPKPFNPPNIVLVTDQCSVTRRRKVAMCIVCRAKPVTHVLVPCGHACLCEGCAAPGEVVSLHRRCPIGRCAIDSVIRFYGTLVEEK